LSKDEQKKSGKGLKIFLYIVLAIFLILIIFVSVLYAYGNSKVDDMIPAVGVHVIDVPITAKSQEYFDVSWNVRGGDRIHILEFIFQTLLHKLIFQKHLCLKM